MSFFWENPLLTNARPKPGQKIQIRVGWNEPGMTGPDMWRTCRVDREDPSRCVSRETDFSIPRKRWKKGTKKPGPMWRPKR